jgi:hypothetical protein
LAKSPGAFGASSVAINPRHEEKCDDQAQTPRTTTGPEATAAVGITWSFLSLNEGAYGRGAAPTSSWNAAAAAASPNETGVIAHAAVIETFLNAIRRHFSAHCRR